MTDCESNFMNKYMGKGVEVPGIRVTTLIDPQLMKASLTTPTFRRDKTIEYLWPTQALDVLDSMNDLFVGDISIPLIVGSQSREDIYHSRQAPLET